MGGMTKVMQKIRADAPATDAPAPSAELPPLTAPDRATLPSSSSFVADRTPTAGAGFPAAPKAPGSGGEALNGAIVTWDAARVDPVIIAFHDRYSAVCEQYRAVRARLLAVNTTRARQVLAITSSVPEEGKSSSTLNLGLVMAEGGEHRVLVADADFRRASIAGMLGVADQPGLAEVLRGERRLEEVIQPTPFPNFKLLPAGQARDGASGELLSSPTTAQVISQCRALFDYTLLDTPPVTTVSDVCLLAPHCDGAIVVIQMRRTPEPTVQQAVRTLQANNVKVLGCVLSRSKDRGASYYAHYYSHDYR